MLISPSVIVFLRHAHTNAQTHTHKDHYLSSQHPHLLGDSCPIIGPLSLPPTHTHKQALWMDCMWVSISLYSCLSDRYWSRLRRFSFPSITGLSTQIPLCATSPGQSGPCAHSITFLLHCSLFPQNHWVRPASKKFCFWMWKLKIRCWDAASDGMNMLIAWLIYICTHTLMVTWLVASLLALSQLQVDTSDVCDFVSLSTGINLNFKLLRPSATFLH